MYANHNKLHIVYMYRWALIKDVKVYDRVMEYMTENTEGTSHDTQLRTLKLIKEILLQMKTKRETMADINQFGYQTLSKRWAELTKLVASSDRFSLQNLSPQYCNYFKKVRDPSPCMLLASYLINFANFVRLYISSNQLHIYMLNAIANLHQLIAAFGWLKCEWEEDTDCEALLRNAQIKTQSGVLFEADSRYTRLSLIKTEDDFDQMMEKLKPLVSAKRSI